MELEKDILKKLFKRFVRLQCPEGIHDEPNKNVSSFLTGLSYLTLLPDGLDPYSKECKLLRRMYRKAWNIELNKSNEGRGQAIVPPVIGYSKLNAFGIPQFKYTMFDVLTDGGTLKMKYNKIYFISIQKERTYGLLYHLDNDQLDFLYVLSMNQLSPIENNEKIHLLKWYYRKEGNKVVENEDLKDTVCLIHGLDLFENEYNTIDLKKQELQPFHFEVPEHYLVYNSFIENIRRLRLERDFFLVSKKDNYFHWFNSAAGYLGMKKGANLAVSVDIDQVRVFEKFEFEEDGIEKFNLVERFDLNKHIQIDNDPKEYVLLLNRIKNILTEKFYSENYEDDPIFEWVKDEPEVTDLERNDDIVYANTKNTNIFESNNITLTMNK